MTTGGGRGSFRVENSGWGVLKRELPGVVGSLANGNKDSRLKLKLTCELFPASRNALERRGVGLTCHWPEY